MVSIDRIKKTLLKSKSLIGKPKGIIIQACQGNVPQGTVYLVLLTRFTFSYTDVDKVE